MSSFSPPPDRFRLVLAADHTPSLFLSKNDLQGGWRELLPKLATVLPEPYPVYDEAEEHVLHWGYPVCLSETLRQINSRLSTLIDRELRLRLEAEGGDPRATAAARDTWSRSIRTLLGNALLNDYGRGFVEILLLLLSAQIQSALKGVPRTVRLLKGQSIDGEKLKIQLATRLGALVVRAFSLSIDDGRKLIDSPARRETSPLLGLLFRDPMLLVEHTLPAMPERIAALLPGRLEGKIPSFLKLATSAAAPLDRLLASRPELEGMLRESCVGALDMAEFRLLQPCLLQMLAAGRLLQRLDITPEDTSGLRALGLHLKALELLARLRRIILPVVADEKKGWMLLRKRRRQPVAASTRPLDFTVQGVVETSVFRFGLIYDLRDFSELMEGVRKQGRHTEESALQFMYVFQSRTEEIAKRRRLHFEKFLGDGAFLTARRAQRTLSAAIEIQAVYAELRKRGFPFSEGMRVALNAGNYHLLPMRSPDGGPPEYEFFGHGIVELARLSTGKSTREIEEVAQMLVGRGYAPEIVEDFLRPLIEVRGSPADRPQRPFPAYLNAHGELINEGVVLTFQFIEALEKELGACVLREGFFDGFRWLVLDLEPELTIGFRFLGIARLKGLDPMELVEAIAWPGTNTETLTQTGGLCDLLRRLSRGNAVVPTPAASDSVPENLVVASYLDSSGRRNWVLGQYRESDGILLQALRIPLEIPREEADRPLEVWLFENRAELAKMYEVLLRDSSGRAVPISKFRSMPDANICFLAAPHRTPE